MIKVNANENKEICSSCKGMCCKKSGCDTASYDFEKKNFDYLMKKLNEGKFSITAAFNPVVTKNGLVNKPFLYIRARNKGYGVVDLFSLKTSCALLLDTGCSFDSSSRPAGGKNLIPNKDFVCTHEKDPKEIILTWRNYQDVLRKLVIHYTGLTPEEQYRIDAYNVFKRLIMHDIDEVSDLELVDISNALQYYVSTYPDEWDAALRDTSFGR